MDLGDFQLLIDKMYSHKDRQRGSEGTFLWLTEEIGELAAAIAENKNQAEKGEEFADVLAWLVTLANVENIDLSKEVSQPRYTIQFGSFQQKEKADALSNKLNKQGYLAHVSTKHIENRGTFYRVRMGSFATQEEAKEWASKLPPLSPSPFITSIK